MGSRGFSFVSEHGLRKNLCRSHPPKAPASVTLVLRAQGRGGLGHPGAPVLHSRAPGQPALSKAGSVGHGIHQEEP